MTALSIVWEVVSSNWIMFLVLVALLVFKAVSPRLRKMWRGGL